MKPPLVVLLLLAFAVRAEAATLALVPAVGDTPREQRQKLDTALRKAAVADGGYEVQGAKDIAEQITFLADQGTICLPNDLPCLQKLAILCDVELLLIAESTGERELDVTLTLLNAEDASVTRAVKGTVNLATDSAKKLVVKALHGGQEEDPPPPPPPDRDTGPKRPNDAPVDETQLNDLQLAGAATAAVGGGLGALALLGALSCEAIFWTGTGNKDTRKDIIAPLGGVLWIASIAGGVVAGAGGGLYLAGAPPEEKSVDALP